MAIIKYEDLPAAIRAIFPNVNRKYPDFLAWKENKPECIKVRFNGEVTPFYLEGDIWKAGTTY